MATLVVKLPHTPDTARFAELNTNAQLRTLQKGFEYDRREQTCVRDALLTETTKEHRAALDSVHKLRATDKERFDTQLTQCKQTLNERIDILTRENKRLQQDAEHTLDATKNSLQHAHKEDTRALHLKIQTLQTEHLQRETTLKQDLDHLKQQHLVDTRAAVDQAVQDLRNELTQQRALHERLLSQQGTREDAIRTNIKQECARETLALEAQLKEATDCLQMAKSVAWSRTKLVHTPDPTGKTFERHIREQLHALSNYTCNYTIPQDVSQQAHQADIQLTCNNMTVLIECKDHHQRNPQASLSKAEIHKARRDLLQHPNASILILVSAWCGFPSVTNADPVVERVPNPDSHSPFPYKTLLFLPKYYDTQPDLAAILHATTSVFQAYPMLNTAPYKEALDLQLRVLKLEDKSKLLETAILTHSKELVTVGDTRRVVAHALRKALDPFESKPSSTETTDDPQTIFLQWFNSTYTLHTNTNTPDTHAQTLTIASLLTKFKHTECYIALPSSLQTHVNRKNLALWLKHTHDCVDTAGKHVLGVVHIPC